MMRGLAHEGSKNSIIRCASCRDNSNRYFRVVHPVILVTLYEVGILEAVFINFVRVLVVSFVRGTFMSMGFFMSLSGAFMSLGIMILLVLLIKKFSIIGVSVIGALFHVTGQILVAMIYMGSVYVVYYLPIIALSALITGVIVGLVAGAIIRTGVIKRQREKYNF